MPDGDSAHQIVPFGRLLVYYLIGGLSILGPVSAILLNHITIRIKIRLIIFKRSYEHSNLFLLIPEQFEFYRNENSSNYIKSEVLMCYKCLTQMTVYDLNDEDYASRQL